MARPSKYNWEDIKLAYEGGLDKPDIEKKYGVTNKTLTNKINKELWEVKGTIKAQINEFEEAVRGIAQNPESIQELIIEKINTQSLDNELINNNRKLAKLLQSVIVSNKTNINLNNIKSVAGTLKDIENIANPTANRTDIQINNTNAQQNNTQIKTIDDIYGT